MKRAKLDIVRIFAFLLLVCGILYFYFFMLSPSSIPYFMRFIPFPRSMNILVMGTDIIFDKDTHSLITNYGHTDTMILVNINTFSNKITLLSIPRDSLVEMPNYGWQKINQANMIGGPALAKKTVEKLLSITVEHYVVVSPKGIIKLIDLMGGIKIYVDKDMNYVDTWGGLYINLKKGWQVLNGKQAHDFIRFRLDPLGDIGRVQRQQNFLKTLLGGFAKPKMIARAPWVIEIAIESVKTDLSFKEMIYLLNYARFLSSNDINMLLLPGKFGIGEYNASIWIPDMAATDKIVLQYFTKKPLMNIAHQQAPTSTVTILYNNITFDHVKSVMQLLSSNSYVILYTTSEARADITRTKVIAQKGDISGARKLAKQIGVEEVEVSSTGNIVTDFTIVLCNDWKDIYLDKVNK